MGFATFAMECRVLASEVVGIERDIALRAGNDEGAWLASEVKGETGIIDFALLVESIVSRLGGC